MRDALPVVTDPPAENDPDSPGRRHLQPNCRHFWVQVKHPLQIPTGLLRCERCKATMRARKEEDQPWTPKPNDEDLGY